MHIKLLFKYAKYIYISLYSQLLLKIVLQMLLFLEDKKYLRVLSDITLEHPEHRIEGQPAILPIGDYWVEIKSEYDHFIEESREVID